VAILGVLGYFTLVRDCRNGATVDSIAFKQSYEELNGQLRDANDPDRVFKSIYIPEVNPFRFVEYDEIMGLLENGGTGVVLLGIPTCPWCRNLVPVLASAAIDFGVKDILYRDILDDRDILTRDAAGNIVTEREGDAGYMRLLEALGDLAPPYRDLGDESIRRIHVPVVLFIENGEIIRYQTSLQSFVDRVEGEELGGWMSMNEAEEQELTELFNHYFERLFGR